MLQLKLCGIATVTMERLLAVSNHSEHKIDMAAFMGVTRHCCCSA